jgi:hypothetical protein
MNLSNFEFSQRAQNVLANCGVTDGRGLVEAARNGALFEAKNCGNLTAREFIAFLVQHHVTLEGIKFRPDMSRKILGEKVPLAGPYRMSERWMLETAIGHLDLGGIAWEVQGDPHGVTGWTLWRQAEGFKPVEAE